MPIWWKTPKDKKSKFAFAFGAPWTWSDIEKRPTLYWESKE
jgi:hypothetical protein